MNEEKSARLAEHLASLAEGAGAGEHCGDVGEIWVAVAGETSARRARELLNHSLGCPACAEVWRLARSVAADTAAPLPAAGRTRRVRWAGWAAAAAVVALAVVVTPRLLRDEQGLPTEPAFRAGDRYTIETRLSEERALPRTELILEWSAGPADTVYAVTLSTLDLEVLHRVDDLSEPSYRVPVDVLSNVPRDTTILWLVEAVHSDGSVVRSPTFQVKVR